MNQSHPPALRKLYLSRTDKKWLGVCGGMGEYFDIDSTLIRLLWVVLTVMTGLLPGLLAYIFAAILMPRRPETEA